MNLSPCIWLLCKVEIGLLGDDNVDELYEYKNLGALKNYVGSFSSNIDG